MEQKLFFDNLTRRKLAIEYIEREKYSYEIETDKENRDTPYVLIIRLKES